MGWGVLAVLDYEERSDRICFGEATLMKEILTDCLWERDRLREVVEPLARAAGLDGGIINGNESIKDLESALSLDDWLDNNLSRLGLETDAMDISYGEVAALIRDCAPAILEYTDSQYHGFLVLLRKRWNRIVLLKPDGSTCRISRDKLAFVLTYEQRESIRPEMNTLLEFADLNPTPRERVLDAFLLERLKNKWIGKCWRVRASPGSDFWKQILSVHAIPLLSGFFISHAATYGVLLL